jgi:8-oxo-dGTP pyrophosphatase MutT (NUDIX family)
VTEAELRRRIADPERRARLAPTGTDDAVDLMPERRIDAAVLVPIIFRAEPTILLTLRASTLSSHAGQVSFAGGRMEDGETPEQAALREAAEEVGLDPSLPILLGVLPEHRTITGYHVTPVLALLTPPFSLTPDPAEVAEIFEYPLARLLQPGGAELHRRELRGRTREYWVWPHETHHIWGATAAMLRNLALLLAN